MGFLLYQRIILIIQTIKKNNENGKDDLNEVKKKGNQEVGCDDILEGCLLLCQCLELILRIAGGN